MKATSSEMGASPSTNQGVKTMKIRHETATSVGVEGKVIEVVDGCVEVDDSIAKELIESHGWKAVPAEASQKVKTEAKLKTKAEE